MSQHPPKILFITSNRVGDAVLSMGVLSWLVDHHPNAQFTIACGPYASELFRAVPRLEKLIILRKRSWNRHWLELWRACVTSRWDIIVDLRNSIVSRLIPASKRFFYKRGTGTHKVVDNAAVIKVSPPPSPKIWLDDLAESSATDLVSSDCRIIAFGPAANWPPKQWPITSFVELALKMTAVDGLFPNAKVMILAEERERPQIAPLLNAVSSSQRVEVVGYNLLTAAACIKKCDLFIGNDSGLMHLAAAIGIPTLGLFGPGYEAIYGPWGTKCRVVRTPESREELLSRLPNMHARSPNLMQGLRVDTVYEAVSHLIKDHIINAN